MDTKYFYRTLNRWITSLSLIFLSSKKLMKLFKKPKSKQEYKNTTYWSN